MFSSHQTSFPNDKIEWSRLCVRIDLSTSISRHSLPATSRRENVLILANPMQDNLQVRTTNEAINSLKILNIDNSNQANLNDFVTNRQRCLLIGNNKLEEHKNMRNEINN
jgi:hypothetical protein